MRRYRNITPIFLTGFAIAVITTIAALHGHSSSQADASNREQQNAEFESQFPIVDSSTPESTDPNKRSQRRAKGKKYNNSQMAIDPSYEVVTTSGHWAIGLSALPIDKSDYVIVGTVTDAQAYLSNDKTGVYSEFTVRIDEVLKNDSPSQLTIGNFIAVERFGGRVRFPSGRIGIYWASGQGMLRIGRRYVLFLASSAENLQIVTGYELRGGHVFLLDNPGQGHPITSYRGADEASLIRDIRNTLSKSSQ